MTIARQRLSRAATAADLLAKVAAVAPPGQRLGTKAELRMQCAVSVGTFNEALKLAQAREVIVLRPGPGGGLFAGSPSPMVRLGNSMLTLDDSSTSVVEAVRLRDALDPLLVEDAVEHRTAEDVAVLRKHLQSMQEAIAAQDPLAFIRANWQLHGAIASVSPHPILKTLYQHLIGLIEAHTIDVQSVGDQSISDLMAKRHALHIDLVDAIEARNRVHAMDIIKEHDNTTGH